MKLTYDVLAKVQAHHSRRAVNYLASSYIEDAQFFTGYAEPGYNSPKHGWIAVGNWNTVSRYNEATGKFEVIDEAPARFAAALERLDVELEWCDEWVACDSCGLIFRTTADSYCWQKSGTIDENGCTCSACLDPVEHLAALEAQDHRCNTISTIDFGDCGYRALDLSFENGLYGGQAADPKKIGAVLRACGISRYVFNLDSTGQLDISFSVWVHKSQARKINKAIAALRGADTNGADPAEMMRRALSHAETQKPAGPVTGVIYTKCNLADGTATTRVVSPQEFADGIHD